MFLPSSGRNNQFNPFQQNQRVRRKNFDKIEDAEFEDLSDKKKNS